MIARFLLHFMRRLARPLPNAIAVGVVVCASVIGTLLYARHVNTVYPIEDWLAWPLLAIWGYTGLCNLAWFSLGSLISGRLLQLRELPHLERAVLSTALGVVGFTELPGSSSTCFRSSSCTTTTWAALRTTSRRSLRCQDWLQRAACWSGSSRGALSRWRCAWRVAF